MTLPTHGLGRVNACIYCGARGVPLEEEHLIPFGLGGEWVLENASCRKCAKITSAFEGHLQRGMMLPGRTALNLPTRKPQNRPSSFVIDAQHEKLHVPISDYPALITLPFFLPPAHLDSREYEAGVNVINTPFVFQVGGGDAQGLVEKLGKAKIVLTHLEYKPVSFARLIAKIAYGFSVARFGLDAWEHVFVVPSILGEAKDVGRWVGCDRRTEISTDGLHGVTSTLKGDVATARVRLFAQFGAPEYLVIVGRVKLSSTVR